ncbi:MAG: glycoside hydrolase superfamily [Monoraphidium minutum]|nr:MAG: glycoside hydrolase superfamily [Monoraphidium minutum]
MAAQSGWMALIIAMIAIFCLHTASGIEVPKELQPLPPPPASCANLASKIIWGGATSAYQIEGAWNVDGKGPSIWDVFSQKGGETQGNATGNVANDHYFRWREDLELMKRLGVKTYRFSIAWTRIVPSGLANGAVNAAGVAWYKALITELLKAGIVPAVTMFHWDLPQELQAKEGGFLAPGPAFQDAFVHYADVLYRELGPLVKLWMTFNEPLSICELGYNKGIFAPGIKDGPAGQYKCGHNLLLAHAKAVKLYRDKYAKAQGGRIGMALDGKWGFPYDPNSQADKDASQAWMEFQYGWMADPVYFGSYPAVMKKVLGQDLPRFTPEESALLKGSMDYFPVNFYCGYYIRAATPGNSTLPFVVYEKGPDGKWVGPPSASTWLFVTPTGLRRTLVWLDKRYSVGGRKVEFSISENGVSGPGEATKGLPQVLDDRFRLKYYSSYLDEMCKAIAQDGVKFSTYWAWSLFDNFEWREAYTQRFGMVYIDLKDNLKRVPKATAYWFANNLYSKSARHDASYYKGMWKGATGGGGGGATSGGAGSGGRQLRSSARAAWGLVSWML